MRPTGPKVRESAGAARKKQARKRAAGGKNEAKRAGTRADLGAPIDGFIARQPAQLRAILEELRGIIEAEVTGVQSSLKWGMPFYTLGGEMMCATSAHKSHVNLIVAGPPGAFADPEGRLSGEGKTGRHLKLTSLDDLPREAVRGWVRTAAELARKKR